MLDDAYSGDVVCAGCGLVSTDDRVFVHPDLHVAFDLADINAPFSHRERDLDCRAHVCRGDSIDASALTAGRDHGGADDDDDDDESAYMDDDSVQFNEAQWSEPAQCVARRREKPTVVRPDSLLATTGRAIASAHRIDPDLLLIEATRLGVPKDRRGPVGVALCRAIVRLCGDDAPPQSYQ